MATRTPRTFEDLLAKYPETVQTTAVAARQALRSWLPKVQEEVDASASLIGFHYGPGYRGLVCTLLVSKTGVKLGLVHGAELSDPRGLLEGRGKVHRYVPLESPSDLEQPGVGPLVKAAHAA